MPLPRMRTAEGILKIIEEQDPESKITLHYIRRIINVGMVPVNKMGRMKLANADEVIAYIAAGAPGLNEATERARRFQS